MKPSEAGEKPGHKTMRSPDQVTRKSAKQVIFFLLHEKVSVVGEVGHTHSEVCLVAARVKSCEISVITQFFFLTFDF